MVIEWFVFLVWNKEEGNKRNANICKVALSKTEMNNETKAKKYRHSRRPLFCVCFVSL
jgi:hypothetical protein